MGQIFLEDMKTSVLEILMGNHQSTKGFHISQKTLSNEFGKKTLEIYWTKFSWKTMLSNEFNSKHRCQKNMSIAAKGPVVVAFGNKGA